MRQASLPRAVYINVIAEFADASRNMPKRSPALLTGLVEPSRAEDGCKGYHLLVDKHDATRLYTYEEWTSEDKLQTHLEGAKAILGSVKELLAALR